MTNKGSNTVTKLRASDGAILGNFAVGQYPTAVAFDGSSVWVTSVGTNSVAKLRSSDGANFGTFSVGFDPLGVAFDGANVWGRTPAATASRSYQLRTAPTWGRSNQVRDLGA